MFVKISDSNVAKAESAWGLPLPAWVRLLAEFADRQGQRAAGDRIGRNSGTVSRIINNRYPGSLAEAEQLVRARMGAAQVNCPLWGTIPLASCIQLRRRRTAPQNHMHRACQRVCPECPNNTDRTED